MGQQRCEVASSDVEAAAPPAPSPSPASRFLRALPSELLPRILSLLPPNDLAGSVRLVCRDALHACHEALLMQHAALMPHVGAAVLAPPLCCCTPARTRPHHLAVPTAPCNAGPSCSGTASANTSSSSSSSASPQLEIGSSSSSSSSNNNSKSSEGCPLCPRFVIHLSQPVPPALFVWRWAPRDATNGLTASQREELWDLTVATGVLQNVRVLRRRTDVYGERAKWERCADVIPAAGSGNLALVRLMSRTSDRHGRALALKVAAANGHTEVCDWLLSTRSTQRQWQNLDVRKSLFGHHERIDRDTARRLLEGASAGLSLSVLTTLYGTLTGAVRGLFPDSVDRERTAHAMLLAAATSATPDWQAKAAWVLGEFFAPASGHCSSAAIASASAPMHALGPGARSSSSSSSITGSTSGHVPSAGVRLTPKSEVCTEVAALPGALPRLQWLQERGCPLDPQEVLVKVVRVSGDTDVLTHLLQLHGVVPGPKEVQHAACVGHLKVLQVLLPNHPYGRGTAESAPNPDGGSGRGPGADGSGAGALGGGRGGRGGRDGRGGGRDGRGGGRGDRDAVGGPSGMVDAPMQEHEEVRDWFRRAVLSAAWCGQVHVLAWLARARRELLVQHPQPQQQQQQHTRLGGAGSRSTGAATAAVFPIAQEVLSAALWDDAIGCDPDREPPVDGWELRRAGRGGSQPPGLGLPNVWERNSWYRYYISESGSGDADQRQLALLRQTPEQRVLRALLWLRHEGTWWPGAPGEVLLKRTWRAPEAAVAWLRAQGVRVERYGGDSKLEEGGEAEAEEEYSEDDNAWDVHSGCSCWSCQEYRSDLRRRRLEMERERREREHEQLLWMEEQQELGGLWCVDGGREARGERWGLRRWRDQGRRRGAVRRAERWWRRLGEEGCGGEEAEAEGQQAEWRSRVEGWVRDGWDEKERRWRAGGREGGWEGVEQQGDRQADGGGGEGGTWKDGRAVVKLGDEGLAEGMRHQDVGGSSPWLMVYYGHDQVGAPSCGAGGEKERGSELGQEEEEGGCGVGYVCLGREEAAGRLLAVQWRRAREHKCRGRGGAAAVGQGRGGGGGVRHGRWAAWIGECIRRYAGEDGAGAGWWWCGWDQGEGDASW